MLTCEHECDQRMGDIFSVKQTSREKPSLHVGKSVIQPEIRFWMSYISSCRTRAKPHYLYLTTEVRVAWLSQSIVPSALRQMQIVRFGSCTAEQTYSDSYNVNSSVSIRKKQKNSGYLWIKFLLCHQKTIILKSK